MCMCQVGSMCSCVFVYIQILHNIMFLDVAVVHA